MKKCFRYFGVLIYSFIGWCFIVPISFFVPKKKKLIVHVGGRKQALFTGNIKYFFHHMQETNSNNWFLTYSKDEYLKIRNAHQNVLKFPSLKSIWYLLRCEIVVVDIYEWVKCFRFFLLFRSKVVQLWHGVGFKRIQLDSPDYIENKKSLMRRIEANLFPLYPCHDLLISTSEFYTEHLFSKAFKSKSIVETGYPRNDVFFRPVSENDLISIDRVCYSEIVKRKKEGIRLVLFVPTHRETGGDPLSDKAIDISSLNKYGIENNLLFVFKFHSYTVLDADRDAKSHIIWYDNEADIYPVLPLADLMVTDYSSIYMDFLLLDKPILFYPYDYDKYIAKDRAIQFDYDWITPGEKCFSQDALLNALTKKLNITDDSYREKRAEIRKIAFKYVDGKASERIQKEIESLMKH